MSAKIYEGANSLRSLTVLAALARIFLGSGVVA
jgi:hypothetical protein